MLAMGDPYFALAGDLYQKDNGSDKSFFSETLQTTSQYNVDHRLGTSTERGPHQHMNPSVAVWCHNCIEMPPPDIWQ